MIESQHGFHGSPMIAPPAALAVLALVAFTAAAQSPAPKSVTLKKEARMAALAHGSFEVKLVPLTEGTRKDAWAPGRMSIDKTFSGDLEGTSQGEMLAAMTDVKGSAGYTAIERVSGHLKGRSGTFLLQHSAVMEKGVPGAWTVMVIPDSGTDGLKGLAGRMTITIAGKDHTYTLEYSLPEAL